MNDEKILKKIEEKYINPTKRNPEKFIGIEFEFPVVNLKSLPVDFEIVHKLAEKFVSEFEFTKISLDEEGNIYCAVSEKNDDGISFDCSYNTLELSFGTEKNLRELYKRFERYYDFIQGFLRKNNHMITGMGVNPNHNINKYEPVHSERYRMLYRHLSSYKKYTNTVTFHNVPNYGMFSCASQVQLDVKEENIPEVLNIFSAIEPLKAVLFANSYWDKRADYLLSRDYFWRNSLHGLNPHNVDAYDIKFSSNDEIIKYIASMSIYCVERDGKYINFAPTKLREYFSKSTVKGEFFNGKEYETISFKPEIDDLKYLRSFKFEDLTYRGTVEFRSVCTQPISEIMGSAAFHVGLMKNADRLENLLENDDVIYKNGYNSIELRDLFSRRELPLFVDKNKLRHLILEILDIANDGLKERQMGENIFLKPLYERGENLLSPARHLVNELENGRNIGDIAYDYSLLEIDKNQKNLIRAFA
jgi:gamma-glutamylcysteine synthetase